jgi:PucR C-terminal helix-turn-helix domain/GGDEF-like domain
MSSEALTVGSAAHRVVAALAGRRERLVAAVVSESRRVGSYARLEPAQVADFTETVREGFDVVVRAMAAHRSFTDDDVRFLRPRIRRRTTAGVTEAEMMAVVRVFERVLWDAIAERAQAEDGGREAAFALARPLIEYIDVLSRAVNEAFAETTEAIGSQASAVRAALVGELLAGREPAPGPELSAARACGLGPASPLAVIVARSGATGGDGDGIGTEVAALALTRAFGDHVEPPAMVHDDEIVIVRCTPVDRAHELGDLLERACGELAPDGLGPAIGISTVHQGWGAIPAAYEEACLALERLGPAGGVLGLGSLDPLDYLVLRAGDATAWRLVSDAVRAFVEEDVRQGGPMCDTVLAYVECDFNAKLAAERLFVHANTFHYRLARIEERTGLSARRFPDLLLLVLAIRLCRSAP